MKKLVTCLVAALACSTCFAACDKSNGNNSSQTSQGLLDAKETVSTFFEGKDVSADFTCWSSTLVDDKSYAITWSVNVDSVTVVPQESDTLIDIDESLTEEFSFVLTATISDGDGNEVSVNFTYKYVPVLNDELDTDAYYMYMRQANTQKILFLNGQTDKDEYLKTTEKADEAVEIFAEKANNSYKFYYVDDTDAKQYIHVYLNSENKAKVKYATETSTVFNYNKEIGYWYSTFESKDYALGTYNTYNTISVSETRHITAENANVSQFLATLIKPDKVSEIPAFDAVADPVDISIADAVIKAQELTKGATTPEQYYVTGKIVEEYSNFSNYGNCYIADELDNRILVYGLNSATGGKFNTIDPQPKVGDTLKLIANIGNYNGTPQLQNAKVLEHTVADENKPAQPTESKKPVAITAAPEVGTAYKFYMYQANKSSVYYLASGMSGYYLATTTNHSEAVDVFAETAEGGFYMYYMDGTAKKYINVETSGTHINAVLGATPTSVWVWDTEINSMSTTLEGTKYYLGTYKDYFTMGPSSIDKAPTSFVGYLCTLEDGTFTPPPSTGGNEGGNEGGENTPPAGGEEVVSSLQEGVAYTVSANNANGPLYLLGTITSGRWDCSTNAADAVSVYVENVTGGQLLYFYANSVKTYFVFSDKAAGGSTTTDASTATVFEWNTTLNTLVVAEDTNNRAFGAGKTSDYNNFSCYDASQENYNWGVFTAATAD